MAPVAADVPNKYDVIINGQGYVFPAQIEEKASFGFTPVFIGRTNTDAAYGDDQQDFWFTWTQKDWRLGEQLKFARVKDEDLSRRYWRGTSVDITIPGQVSIRPLTAQTSAFGAAITEVAGSPAVDKVYATSTTNLYSIDPAGTVADLGAHGVGFAPVTIAVAYIGTTNTTKRVYMSSTGGGGGKIRQMTAGGAFSDFSATPSDSIAFVNNTLFGYRANTGEFIRYDAAGAVTSLYTWKNPTGEADDSPALLLPYGGKVVILRTDSSQGSELWIYDGTSPSLAANLPLGFKGQSLATVGGIIFVGGYLQKRFSGATYRRPAIYFYSNGTIGQLWQADTWVVSTSARETVMVNFGEGLVFTDDTRGVFMIYDTETGGVHTIGSYTFTDATPRIAGTSQFFIHTRSATTPWRYPADGFSSSSTVTSALIDFESSLNKLFRGIKVEFDPGTGGDTGSVDIAYRVGDIEGSYTTLQTGATSGTEYLLTNITGRSISIKITLNLGTSTNSGPLLKRVSLRAVPVQSSIGASAFNHRQYVLALTGREGETHLVLNNGEPHPKDGKDMMTDLKTAASSATPFTIVDYMGSFTGVIENDGFEATCIRNKEWVAKVKVREV